MVMAVFHRFRQRQGRGDGGVVVVIPWGLGPWGAYRGPTAAAIRRFTFLASSAYT